MSFPIIFAALFVFQNAFAQIHELHYELLGKIAREPGVCHVKTTIELNSVKMTHETFEQKLSELHLNVRKNLPSEKMKSQWDKRIKNLKDVIQPAYSVIDNVFYLFGLKSNWTMTGASKEMKGKTEKKSVQTLSYHEKLDFYKSMTKSRNKRAIGIDDIFSGFGLALSIYNTVEIQKINGRVSQNTADIETIIKHISHSDLQIKKIDENVQHLRDVENKLLDYSMEEKYLDQFDNMYRSMLISCRNYTNHVEKWEMSLINLIQGRIDVNLINPKKLESALMDVEQKLVKEGYQMVIPKEILSEVFKTDISYVTDPTQNHINVFLHLPISKGNHFNLLKYVNLPFPTSSMNISLMLSSPTGNEFLAVNEEKTLSVELSNNDFLKCRILHQVYVCPNTNLIKRNLNSGCLAAIYSSELTKAKAYCKVVAINSSSEFMKQINDNSVAIYSSKPMTVTKSCVNSKDKSEMIEGFKIYEIDQKCSLLTDNFFFRPSYKFQLTEFIIQPLEFHVDKLIEHLDSDEINNIMREKSKLSDYNEIDITDIEREIETSRLNSHSTYTYIMIPLIAIILVVLIIIIFFLVYRIILTKKLVANRHSRS